MTIEDIQDPTPRDWVAAIEALTAASLAVDVWLVTCTGHQELPGEVIVEGFRRLRELQDSAFRLVAFLGARVGAHLAEGR